MRVSITKSDHGMLHDYSTANLDFLILFLQNYRQTHYAALTQNLYQNPQRNPPQKRQSQNLTHSNERIPPLYPTLSVKVHRQHLITTRHIRHARPTRNIRLLLPHHLPLPINRRLIRPPHPVPHRTRQRHLPVRLLHHGRMRRVPEYVFVEPVAAIAAVRRGDRGGAVAALLEADVAVRRMVVGRGQLEFDPGGWQGGASLDAAFESRREGDEGCGGWADGGGFFGVRKVCAGGAVAVPVVWVLS